jgi:hypothetical protein
LYQYEVFPTQVSKSVEILDRSLVLHEKKRQEDIQRSPLQLSSCKGIVHICNQKKRSGSSKVLMNMELVEGKLVNRLLFSLSDSSSSSSSPCKKGK